MITRISADRMDSNTYLVTEGRSAVIIDAASGSAVLREVREKGLVPEFILLTHEHFDHIWDLEELRKEFSVPVAACRICSERIQDVKTNLSNIADILYYYKTGVVLEGRSKTFTCRPAEIVYEDRYSMEWRGHRFDFQRLPGHSPGSVVITLDGNSCFTGDYLILGEEEITRLKGGSEEDYQSITRSVLEAIPEGTRIFPGHGDEYIKGQESIGNE